jgi:NADPH2:quinone reductase
MRAIQVSRLDGPAAVELVEVEEPTADPGQVLIEVAAAGVAFPDLLQTYGRYQVRPDLPFVPGSEVVGYVRQVHPGSSLVVGQRVAALSMSGGGFAEVVTVAESDVLALPPNVSTDAAAGIVFNELTVQFALMHRGRLRAGETVLVHGAAGGIGAAAVRQAEAFGAARVVAVVSTPSKAAAARAAGATHVVMVEDWHSELVELLGPRPVDIVVDPVGGQRFTDSLRSLADGGRVLVVGFAAGDIPTVRVNRLLLNNIEVVGVSWGSWLASRPGWLREQWAQFRPLLETGRLTLPEPRTFAMADAADALGALEAKTAIGKIVLTTASGQSSGGERR